MDAWLGLTVPLLAWESLTDVWSPSSLLALCVFFVVIRFLHLFTPPQVSSDPKSASMQQLLSRMSILREPYKPPALWGRSGHVQTAAYGLLGHATLKRQSDRRASTVLRDGTTVTFDVFEPVRKHASGRDFTLVLTPGIANSSESNYIRTCVHYAQEKGYRCAVLNHLGALQDVPLTSRGTDELEGMMEALMAEYPQTRFINVGFSMGGNITTRYLHSLAEEKRSRIVVGLSVCQGYSATASAPLTHDWENGRRAYNLIITENMKRLLGRNLLAVTPHVQSGLVDEHKLWACTSIIALDELYNRRVHGFSSLDSYYKACSSLPIIPLLSVPVIFMNAEDDPIVPESLWKPVQELAAHKPNIAHVLTRFGGHLGFLEGSSFAPRSVTWLDRFIVELAEAAVATF